MRILPEEMYADIINPGECFPRMSSFFYDNELEISKWLGGRFPEYMYTLNLEKEFGLINWRVIAIKKSPEYFVKYNRAARIFLLEKIILRFWLEKTEFSMEKNM